MYFPAIRRNTFQQSVEIAYEMAENAEPYQCENDSIIVLFVKVYGRLDLIISGVQEGVRITLDCAQAAFVSYDKLVLSLKGGEL